MQRINKTSKHDSLMALDKYTYIINMAVLFIHVQFEYDDISEE